MLVFELLEQWFLYHLFKWNPTINWSKHCLLQQAYIDYFKAMGDLKEKKAIIKISMLTQLTQLKAIMDRFSKEVNFKQLKLPSSYEDGNDDDTKNQVNGYNFFDK